MANTRIQLKHSTIQGNVPVTLANGEISINTYDGKIFYSKPDGTIQEFSGFTGPSGLNGEVQFNDSGTLGANAGLSFNKTTSTLSVGSGAVVAGINVVPQIQRVYNHANASFNVANSAITFTSATTPPVSPSEGDQWYNTTSDILYEYINDGTSLYWVDITSSAVATGNVLITISGLNTANFAFDRANAAFVQANAAFVAANTPSHVANSAAIYANGAFTRANNSLNANNGGTVTANVVINANLQTANVTTNTYIQFGDGTRQHTASPLNAFLLAGM